MSNRTNSEYLRSDQYRDAGKLNARINLHQRFTTNPADWFRWVFDHFDLPAHASLLEVGCGPGRLWARNLDRIPPGWQVCLSDFSLGMLHEARATLRPSPGFHYLTLDAQAIPLPTSSFDLLIADHMLYHVPDRPRAIAELSRVLKPGGRLLAATNGLQHMHQVRELLIRLDPDLAARTDHAFGVSEFTIENGADQLAPFFSSVRCDPFPDSLEVTQVEPLLAYLFSMTMASDLPDVQPQVEPLASYLDLEIASRGSFHITKSTALFLAQK